MQPILLVIQIIVSVLIVLCVAFQQSGAGLGSAFGGGGEFHATRRGLEKKLYIATIVLTCVFIALGVLNLLM
jgi:protein translocase SecG subunit